MRYFVSCVATNWESPSLTHLSAVSFIRDTILSINGHEVNTLQDCMNAFKISSSRILTVVTFNVFRKAKTLMVPPTADDCTKKTQRNIVPSQKSFEDMYEIGVEVSL